MHVLRVAFGSAAGKTSRFLIDYVLDAGHQVVVLENSFDQGTYPSHPNLTFVPEYLSLKDVDIGIRLSQDDIFPDDLPQLTVHLICKSKALDIQIFLEKDGGEALLHQDFFQPADYIKDSAFDIHKLAKDLVEVLIDAVIQLSRFGCHYWTCQQPKTPKSNLEDILFFEKHDQGKAQPFVTDTLLERSTCTFKLGQHPLALHEIEALMVLLFSLFQGRRMGPFPYAVWTQSTSPFGRERCCIPQRITLSKTLSTQTLLESAKKSHEILLNPFLVGDPLGAQEKALFPIFYGIPRPQMNPCILSCHYDPDHQVFNLTFPKEWSFFEATERYLGTFLPSLKTPEKTCFDLLCDVSFNMDSALKGPIKPISGSSIHQRFEAQAYRTPHQTAVKCGYRTLSYQDLSTQSNAIAALLIQDYTIRPKDHVALCMSRDVEMVVALLGALKAGAAYVPLDPRHPQERLRTILQDAGVRLVLTDGCLPETLGKNWRSLDVQSIEGASHTGQLPQNVDENACAYVMYTSGTTGKPKGVVVSHTSVLNLVDNIALETMWEDSERFLAVTTFSFDISTLEILGPLLKGGTVVLAKEDDVLNPKNLCNIIARENITILQATPSLWQGILEAPNREVLSGVKAFCGGEALSFALKEKLCQHTKAAWNVYGPTETTIWSTCAPLLPHQPVSMGKPLANTVAYILDQDRRPVPKGAQGELYIGGVGVSSGYWGKPELTAASFIESPFQQDRDFGSNLYKTGDLVRLDAQGDLVFIGRCDTQVKVRGHRIELGEIEAALAQDPIVHMCAVIPHGKTSGEDALVAYVKGPTSLDVDRLSRFLSSKLPNIMIPETFMVVEAFPLNVHGKIDRSNLPAPQWDYDSVKAKPQTETEQKLLKIWAEVLKISADQLGVEDDFFHLGGSSLSGIHLVNKINRTLNADIQIRDVFQEKTIRRLSPLVRKSQGSFLYQAYQITPDPNRVYEPFPLSTVQQTYYLGRFPQFELGNIATHIYTVYRYASLDVDRLEKAFDLLLKRHLVLRTTFNAQHQSYATFYPAYKIAVYEDLENKKIAEIRAQLSHKVYAPDTFPLFDIVVTRHQGYVLLHLSFEAILIDMTSFHILFEEWSALYQDLDTQLPPLEITYRDYVQRYEALRQSKLFDQAKAYWQSRVDAYHLEMQLPLKIQPQSIQKPHFKRLSRVIATSVWERIKSKARAHGFSPTAVILEVYGRVLCHWSGRSNLAINLTLFNRLPLHEQVDRILGDFTVLGLFAYESHSGNKIAHKVSQTHERLLEDIEHNLFDGVDFQRLLKQEKGLDPRAIIAPVVLTSVLGNAAQEKKGLFDLPLNAGYQGIFEGISQTSQTWLDHKAYETHEGFVAEWDYIEDLFETPVMEAMHRDYCHLLTTLADKSWEDDPFPRIELPAQDLEQIKQTNAVVKSFSSKTLVSFLDNQQENQMPALWDERNQQFISYAHLARDSQHLAHFLHAILKSDEPLVGVLCEKGYDQVLATCAIMKTGRAYLPLSVEWPQGRCKEILETAGVKTLVITHDLLGSSQHLVDHVWSIEDICTASHPCVMLPTVDPTDTAYVIFTSGSTGKPKGVSIAHAGAVNTIDAINEHFVVSAKDRILAVSDLSFDLSVYDLFGVLAVGGCIVFPHQNEAKNPQHWKNLIQIHGVTLWNTVPQLAGLLAEGTQQGALDSLRLFLVSGDWVPMSLPGRLRAMSPQAQAFSLGGATEASIWSIWYDMADIMPEMTSVPYGFPMPGQQMYVLNQELGFCPIGVPGDLYIGGMGLAKNYWNAPDLTQNAFIRHPTLGRLYRTGDQGKRQQDGSILFLGRKDAQIKLNGFRVECLEIESKLASLPGVESAYVTIQSEKERDLLVGHLLCSSKGSLESTLQNKQEKDAFLFQKKGLIQTLEASHFLDVKMDEALWKRNKSYRRFQRDPIDVEVVQRIVCEIQQPQPCLGNKNQLDVQSLTKVLSGFSGIMLQDRILPKYRYPSAGSSYGVRLYLELPGAIEKIQEGIYYYHPLKSALCPVLDGALKQNQLNHITFLMVAHWPAIDPLYGGESLRLATLEAGHMIGVLISALKEEGLGCSVENLSDPIDQENRVLARVTVGSATDLSFNHTKTKMLSSDSLELDLPTQINPLGGLLKRSQYMVCFQAEQTPKNWLHAGIQAQWMMERLIDLGIGSCPLGWKGSDKDLYILALGPVTDAQMDMPESCPEYPCLKEIVQETLKDKLPSYMIPSRYQLIQSPPLNPNGKLDRKRLPKFVLETQALVPPQGEMEIRLHALWADLLKMERGAVGVEDSFFLLGGNSLTAMTLTQKIQGQLGLSCSLACLYQHSTIRQLASFLGTQQTVPHRERGVL